MNKAIHLRKMNGRTVWTKSSRIWRLGKSGIGCALLVVGLLAAGHAAAAVNLSGKPRVIGGLIDIGAYEARLPGTLLIFR